MSILSNITPKTNAQQQSSMSVHQDNTPMIMIYIPSTTHVHLLNDIIA